MKDITFLPWKLSQKIQDNPDETCVRIRGNLGRPSGALKVIIGQSAGEKAGRGAQEHWVIDSLSH
jgi:hypothetical protein